MDNDEVAIVLGHELVHATHEHTRRQMKKGLWIGIIGAAGAVASQEIKNDKARKGASIAVALSTLAWSNSYSRDLEDQADRVGLRYAYEAGFDVSKGPRLWLRFSEKYGERSKVENFFFGNHSLSQDRAKKLQYQMTLNYPDVARRISGMWDLAK
jgi:predicted Zn-dependent protease